MPNARYMLLGLASSQEDFSDERFILVELTPELVRRMLQRLAKARELASTLQDFDAILFREPSNSIILLQEFGGEDPWDYMEASNRGLLPISPEVISYFREKQVVRVSSLRMCVACDAVWWEGYVGGTNVLLSTGCIRQGFLESILQASSERGGSIERGGIG